MNKYELIFEAVQEALDNNEITLEEAEALNGYAYDKYIMESAESERKQMIKFSKIEDDSKLKEVLINHASKSKFTDTQYKLWSDTYNHSDREVIIKKLKSMDLGTCYGDGDGNYVNYSFKTKKFYFFDSENDGRENLSHEWTIERIRKHLSK